MTTKGAIINEQYDLSGRRYYKSNAWLFPSITSILDSQPEKQEGLQRWKDYLLNTYSEDEALQIMQAESEYGRERGTAVHELVMNYLIEGREPFDMEDTPEVLFFQMQDELDKIKYDLDNPAHRCEEIVYSEKLGVAGRMDYIAEYDGVLSVIDIKTSKKLKPKREREAWFLQCCFYALANCATNGDYIENLVIINAREDNKTSVYQGNIFDYLEPLQEAINYFKENEE